MSERKEQSRCVQINSKYDNDNANFVRSNEIINSMPFQLTKENRKFQYGFIKKGGRSKDYDGSINILVANNILNRSYRLLDVKSPLSSMRDLESFKLYVNDVGLLYTMLHLNINNIVLFLNFLCLLSMP